MAENSFILNLCSSSGTSTTTPKDVDEISFFYSPDSENKIGTSRDLPRIHSDVWPNDYNGQFLDPPPPFFNHSFISNRRRGGIGFFNCCYEVRRVSCQYFDKNKPQFFFETIAISETKWKPLFSTGIFLEVHSPSVQRNNNQESVSRFDGGKFSVVIFRSANAPAQLLPISRDSRKLLDGATFDFNWKRWPNFYR